MSDNSEKKKVFISYAREDIETARKLCDDLSDAGTAPWLNYNELIPGQNWKTEITKAIKGCRHFIALLSTNSVEKRGFVQTELKKALEVLSEIPGKDIFIIPARIDDCGIPDELADLHCADLFPSYEMGFETILKSIEADKPGETETVLNIAGKTLIGDPFTDKSKASVSEKQAEIIEKLYLLVVETKDIAQELVFQWSPNEQLFSETRKIFKNLREYFDRNRIYLSKVLCDKIENYISISWKTATYAYVWSKVSNPDYMDKSEVAYEQCESAISDSGKMTKAFKELENSFRIVIGVDKEEHKERMTEAILTPGKAVKLFNEPELLPKRESEQLPEIVYDEMKNCIFDISVTDSDFIGKPREKIHTSHHKIAVSITRKLIINWRLNENIAVMVMYQKMKEYIEEKLKSDSLLEKEVLLLSTKTEEDNCPYEDSNFVYPIKNDIFEISEKIAEVKESATDRVMQKAFEVAKSGGIVNITMGGQKEKTLLLKITRRAH
ncbi:MAG: toll/interleukin-1 receptor domain-containing protein [Desulfobacterales bacterium]|nr:toll/interleukin-1 receptor domain-containing protein [Desulfobacterales bacterium]